VRARRIAGRVTDPARPAITAIPDVMDPAFEHPAWYSKAGSTTLAEGSRLTDWPHACTY
jgi:hypothetical protein